MSRIQTRKWFMNALLAGSLMATGVAMPAMAAQVKIPLITANNDQTPKSFADLIEQVSPAVVSVNVIIREDPEDVASQMDQLPEPFKEFLERQMPGFNGDKKPQPREGRALGSGFVISSDGYIVTNHHVIDHATDITVNFSDGREMKAKVVGSDERTDLAVLKVQTDKPLSFVKFAKKDDVRVGDWVIAVGNPYGLGGTATVGIVSARGRAVPSSPYDFIQLDAPINRGNSGGPTFDVEGKVVGVNSQILSPTGGNIGIGFAIPADVASKITSELIKEGHITRGWLGVQVQSLTRDMADAAGLDKPEGAMVAQVLDGTPAKKAGFKDGDIIVKLDGDAIKDNRDLTRRVGDLIVGHKARFVINRDGKEKTLTVTIAERKDEDGKTAPTPEKSTNEPDEFGLVLGSIGDDDQERLGMDTAQGVLIEQVKPSSQASRKGLRPGDALISAGGQTLDKPSDFAKAVAAERAAGKKAIRILVRTRGGQTYTALRLDDDKDD